MGPSSGQSLFSAKGATCGILPTKIRLLRFFSLNTAFKSSLLSTNLSSYVIDSVLLDLTVMNSDQNCSSSCLSSSLLPVPSATFIIFLSLFAVIPINLAPKANV
ncbi:hypothetical protein V8G54_024287 [Vigna mungo]|uniref:Uncharacterized protein n=1 Tax=Vigna mungo TaxID=3915 RepID=A0AAQ3RTB7_VIGMU